MSDSEIDVTLGEAREAVRLGEATLKLIGSQAWKDVIEEFYFDDELKRMVDASMNLAMTKDQRDNIGEKIKGIPLLKGFIFKMLSTGEQGRQVLEDYENGLGEDN